MKYLRPLEERDIEELRQWRNFSRAGFLDDETLITRDMQAAWFIDYQFDDTDHMYALTDEFGYHLGFTCLTLDEPFGHSAELGKNIVNPQKRRQGLGLRLIILALKQARILELTKVYAIVKSDNEAMLALYRNIDDPFSTFIEKYEEVEGKDGNITFRFDIAPA